MTVNRTHLSHLSYRPDIDGLRAFAVLTVVAFHAFPTYVKGGFIGVDIFFVISGYLISTIIFENLDKGTFNFLEFYSRRIKRIFPALLIVLIACIAFGWFAMLADEYKQLGKHLASGAGFISNFILWNEAGYFDNSADTKPLLHLWSLGIEEQFYIFWPVFLWLAWKCKFNLLTFTILLTIGSFNFNINYIKSDLIAAFYSPQSRFWELLSGSLLAWVILYSNTTFYKFKVRLDFWLTCIIFNQKRIDNSNTLANVLSFAGVFLLTYGLLHIDKTAAFPGKFALVPVFGTLLIIAAGNKAWFNKIILSNKVAVWLGMISFPLYLWHWPLLSFARILEGGTPSRDIRILAVILSFTLASITFRIIEHPIRFYKSRNNTLLVLALLFVMSIVGFSGYAIYKNNGFEFRVAKFINISNASGEWHYPGKLIPFKFEGKQFYRENSNNKEITLFIGDSNVEQYYVRANELIIKVPQAVNSIIFSASGACLPIPQTDYDDDHKGCEYLMESSFNFAQNDTNVKNVVIGALWSAYLVNGYAVNGHYGYNGKDYLASLDRLSTYLRRLKNLGKNVYLILNIPTGNELDPKFMVKRSVNLFLPFFTLRDGGLSRHSFNEKYALLQTDLIKIANASGVKVINPIDYLCNSVMCPSLDNEYQPIYKDSAHLNPKYVRTKVFFIDDVLVNSSP